MNTMFALLFKNIILLIREKITITPGGVKEVLVGVALGLHYLPAVVHGDMNSCNVLVKGDLAKIVVLCQTVKVWRITSSIIIVCSLLKP